MGLHISDTLCLLSCALHVVYRSKHLTCWMNIQLVASSLESGRTLSNFDYVLLVPMIFCTVFMYLVWEDQSNKVYYIQIIYNFHTSIISGSVLLTH